MYRSAQESIRRSALLALSVTCGLASAMQGAFADDVNAVSNTAQINVGLVDVNFLTVNIVTTAPRELVIHYSAECRVEDGYIEYDILVDGVQVPPTHDNFSALCSSPPASASAATTVFRSVAAGGHSVRVRGHVEAGVGPGRIDDQSLVVTEEGP
jgi:hypothetical protein